MKLSKENIKHKTVSDVKLAAMRQRIAYTAKHSVERAFEFRGEFTDDWLFRFLFCNWTDIKEGSFPIH